MSIYYLCNNSLTLFNLIRGIERNSDVVKCSYILYLITQAILSEQYNDNNNNNNNSNSNSNYNNKTHWHGKAYQSTADLMSHIINRAGRSFTRPRCGMRSTRRSSRN